MTRIYLRDNIKKTLQINLNSIVSIHLDRLTLERSTIYNYRYLDELPMRFLYKKKHCYYVLC